MKRHWGGAGVADFTASEIAPHYREQILLELKAHGSAPPPPAFFDALATAVSMYQSHRNTVDASKPAEVRKNLQGTIDAALILNKKLNRLDANSHQLVNEVEQGGSEALRIQIANILRLLEQASHLADEYPMRGRLQEEERLWLAKDVANAISTHLGAKPTATKNGLFESTLAIVLEVAIGKEVSSVHDLARTVLKIKKNQAASPKDD